MTQNSDSTHREGQILGKKYQVRRLLGTGGMGAVYEAEHLLTKRLGALKLLHAAYARVPNVVTRFQREASAAGRIGNPHIVETFDAGELEDGQPFLFMELLRGQSLRELLATRGRLSLPDAVSLVLQAADGLAAAHEAGIVHRDVKPENLFVCDGPEPFVKILDFGISKFAVNDGVSNLTEQGAPMGTPHYMAPEQVVSKRDLDGRVDVYALGVVLYECLTGRPPFEAASLPALSVKICEGRYVPATQLTTDLPSAVDAVIGRAIARAPSARFASIPELGEALAALRNPTLHYETTSDAPAERVVPHRVAKRRVGKEALLVLPFLGLAAVALFSSGSENAPSPAEPVGSAALAPSHPQPSVGPEPSSAAPSPSNAAPSPSSATPSPSSATLLNTKLASGVASVPRGPSARVPAPPAPRAKPASSAAADGLVERNPFAD